MRSIKDREGWARRKCQERVASRANKEKKKGKIGVRKDS